MGGVLATATEGAAFLGLFFLTFVLGGTNAAQRTWG